MVNDTYDKLIKMASVNAGAMNFQVTVELLPLGYRFSVWAHDFFFSFIKYLLVEIPDRLTVTALVKLHDNLKDSYKKKNKLRGWSIFVSVEH